jgi:hypothetical protein
VKRETLSEAVSSPVGRQASKRARKPNQFVSGPEWTRVSVAR